MAVRPLKTSRAWRHHFHSFAKAAAYLLALVSSHHRADVLVVLVHGIHCISSLVRCYELLRTLAHVHLLRAPSTQIPSTTLHFNGDHCPATHSDGRRMRYQRLGARVSTASWPRCLQHFTDQHQAVNRHVCQLLHSFRSLLPPDVLVIECSQGQEARYIIDDIATSETARPQSQSTIRSIDVTFLAGGSRLQRHKHFQLTTFLVILS